MKFMYTVKFQHEDEKYNREVNLNEFEAAETIYWGLVVRAKDITGNYTSTLIRNPDDVYPEGKILYLVEKNL